MAFRDLKGPSAPKPKAASARSFRYVKAFASASTPTAIFVVFGRDLLAELGDLDYMQVMVGEGEHSGFLAFIPRAVEGVSTYRLYLPSPRSARSQIGVSRRLAGIPGGSISSTHVPFEVTEDGVICDFREVIHRLSGAPLLAAAAE